nr:ribonuclease H-like domain-containing protein [Tanacetum cinerariifolium]
FQLDINNAFLYGDLSKDVCMTLSLGFDNQKGKVCKLNKSLYGLKQAPRQWNAKLTMALLETGFVQSKFDYSLFTKKSDKVFITLLVYMDDIVITETDDDHLLDNIRNYYKLVGKLIYLTNTRPGISYVVHCLSRYMHAPLVSHLDAAVRVLRYLKGSLESGIQINKSGNLKLRAYADSDWARCLATRKSVSDLLHVVMYCDNSSALHIAANPVFHEKFKHFEIDVHLVREKVASDLLHVVMYCDNSSALQIAANLVFHEKFKHFEIDVHLVREKVASGIIQTEKIHTS